MPFLRAKCQDFLRGSVAKIPHINLKSAEVQSFFEEPKSHKLSAGKKREGGVLKKIKVFKNMP